MKMLCGRQACLGDQSHDRCLPVLRSVSYDRCLPVVRLVSYDKCLSVEWKTGLPVWSVCHDRC